MRDIIHPQIQLGALDISAIKLDLKSRDEIPQILLGILRLGLNADYDHIQELANQHNTIRQMLGHSDWSDETHYALQTLRGNLRLFAPEIMDRINLVLDTPPILAVTDASLIAQFGGQLFLLLRYDQHHMNEIKAAISIFEKNGVTITGVFQ